MKSQMLLRKTLYRTKHFVRKTLNNLESFLFGRYRKLSKAPLVNPFLSVANGSRKMQELDDFYRVFSEQRAPSLDELQKGKKEDAVSPEELVMGDEECGQTIEQAQVENEKWEECRNGSSRVLSNRMKEFKMFDVDDVDHQLDIEEVLHYYSRLTCPVFVDIVDNFFMDMYSEYNLPEPHSVSVNSSMRKLGPVKLSTPCVS